mmetsp:Transcript_26771/g.43830  ORF Transcript_26771/g.43830 Transcript_26771/m.43830 type:complete len:350 (+) Transcript_26771:159-1208(+)
MPASIAMHQPQLGGLRNELVEALDGVAVHKLVLLLLLVLLVLAALALDPAPGLPLHFEAVRVRDPLRHERASVNGLVQTAMNNDIARRRIVLALKRVAQRLAARQILAAIEGAADKHNLDAAKANANLDRQRHARRELRLVQRLLNRQSALNGARHRLAMKLLQFGVVAQRVHLFVVRPNNNHRVARKLEDIAAFRLDNARHLLQVAIEVKGDLLAAPGTFGVEQLRHLGEARHVDEHGHRVIVVLVRALDEASLGEGIGARRVRAHRLDNVDDGGGHQLLVHVIVLVHHRVVLHLRGVLLLLLLLLLLSIDSIHCMRTLQLLSIHLLNEWIVCKLTVLHQFLGATFGF